MHATALIHALKYIGESMPNEWPIDVEVTLMYSLLNIVSALILTV